MMIRIEVSTFLKEVQAVAYRSFSRGAPGSFLRHISARSPGARGAKKSPSHHHPNNIHQRLNTTINAPRPPATVRLLVRLKQHRSFVQRNSSWSKRLVANLVARSSSHRLVTGGRPPNPSEENQDSASTLSSSSLSINSSQSSQSSWWEQAQSLPNLITISRIASAPVLGYYIATEQTQYALILCGLAGLSDWLDGHIARRYNLATKLGSYLDPLGTCTTTHFFVARSLHDRLIIFIIPLLMSFFLFSAAVLWPFFGGSFTDTRSHQTKQPPRTTGRRQGRH